MPKKEGEFAIDAVKRYLQEHPEGDVTIAGIADQSGFTVATFSLLRSKIQKLLESEGKGRRLLTHDESVRVARRRRRQVTDAKLAPFLGRNDLSVKEIAEQANIPTTTAHGRLHVDPKRDRSREAITARAKRTRERTGGETEEQRKARGKKFQETRRKLKEQGITWGPRKPRSDRKPTN